MDGAPAIMRASREWPYKDMKPVIVAEELLLDETGQIPSDYKLHCFGGKVATIQVDLDREIAHRRNFYDLDWKLQPFIWTEWEGDQALVAQRAGGAASRSVAGDGPRGRNACPPISRMRASTCSIAAARSISARSPSTTAGPSNGSIRPNSTGFSAKNWPCRGKSPLFVLSIFPQCGKMAEFFHSVEKFSTVWKNRPFFPQQWKKFSRFFHTMEKFSIVWKTLESRRFMDIQEVDKWTAQALAELAGAADLAALEALRVKYIGRNGLLPELMQGLKDVAGGGQAGDGPGLEPLQGGRDGGGGRAQGRAGGGGQGGEGRRVRFVVARALAAARAVASDRAIDRPDYRRFSAGWASWWRTGRTWRRSITISTR